MLFCPAVQQVSKEAVTKTPIKEAKGCTVHSVPGDHYTKIPSKVSFCHKFIVNVILTCFFLLLVILDLRPVSAPSATAEELPLPVSRPPLALRHDPRQRIVKHRRVYLQSQQVHSLLPVHFGKLDWFSKADWTFYWTEKRTESKLKALLPTKQTALFTHYKIWLV